MKEKEFLPLVASRLGISELNPMQRRMLNAASDKRDIVLLSPTGTGKTLAFLLPMLKMLRPSKGQLQAVIIAPSRELVLQIYGVLREISGPFKVTPLYGGHKVEDEVNSLHAGADIAVATPGRLLDHIRRRNIDVVPCRIAVLDEFDKSLELGFEEEMKKIFARLKNLSRIILTSATRMEAIPAFIALKEPLELSYLSDNGELRHRLRVHRVDSDSRDKLQSLLQLLRTLSKDSPIERTIIFVNHRESADRVAQFLRSKGVDCVEYHGALDQTDREKAVALFNNGSRPVLVATDLAARGLDIESVANVIHYHMPLQPETWTHRNGRTARVDASGDVYLLAGPDEDIPQYVSFDDTFYSDPEARGNLSSDSATVFISAGKKEKLSRGDILGFLCNDGGIPSGEIGKIDVRDHYSLVCLKKEAASALVARGSSFRIKGEKRKVSEVRN